MSPSSDQSGKDRASINYNLTVAAVLGQVGCLTTAIVLAALFGGLWLDRVLDSKPMFTVGLMILSIPVTLVMMFWIVRSATAKFARISKSKSNPESKEEISSGQ